jgi:hypothetical protein
LTLFLSNEQQKTSMTKNKNKLTSSSVNLDQEYGKRGTEEREKFEALKKAIQEGIDSGIVHNFDFDKHLESLKEKKRSEKSK